jgi:hypothetical protein
MGYDNVKAKIGLGRTRLHQRAAGCGFGVS